MSARTIVVRFDRLREWGGTPFSKPVHVKTDNPTNTYYLGSCWLPAFSYDVYLTQIIHLQIYLQIRE